MCSADNRFPSHVVSLFASPAHVLSISIASKAAEFLEAVVDLDLADVEVAVGVGPDTVGAGCELAGFVAGLGAAPVAEELAVERPDADALFELGDVDDFAIGVEVDGVGFEEAGALLKEVAVGVEELDAVVGAVADPDAVVLVEADAVGECELAGAFSPVAQERMCSPAAEYLWTRALS